MWDSRWLVPTFESVEGLSGDPRPDLHHNREVVRNSDSYDAYPNQWNKGDASARDRA